MNVCDPLSKKLQEKFLVKARICRKNPKKIKTITEYDALNMFIGHLRRPVVSIQLESIFSQAKFTWSSNKSIQQRPKAKIK